jgi:hypothetical protein
MRYRSGHQYTFINHVLWQERLGQAILLVDDKPFDWLSKGKKRYAPEKNHIPAELEITPKSWVRGFSHHLSVLKKLNPKALRYGMEGEGGGVLGRSVAIFEIFPPLNCCHRSNLSSCSRFALASAYIFNSYLPFLIANTFLRARSVVPNGQSFLLARTSLALRALFLFGIHPSKFSSHSRFAIAGAWTVLNW